MSDEELVVKLDEAEDFGVYAEEEAMLWSINTAFALIVVGSLLGLWFGVLLFAADPQDVLENPLFLDDSTATVNGQIITAADVENQTGGEPVEGLQILLLNIEDQPTSHNAYTNRDGRFTIENVPQQSFILKVSHEGNKTLRITFNPGDQADLSLTLTPGEGIIEEDIRQETDLDSPVLLASIVASLTIVSALLGIMGAFESRRSMYYRRTQYLCGLALFSRGGVFIGPMLILAGMALLSATKNRFEDIEENED